MENKWIKQIKVFFCNFIVKIAKCKEEKNRPPLLNWGENPDPPFLWPIFGRPPLHILQPRPPRYLWTLPNTNYLENKYVFSLALNCSRDVAKRILLGRAFHRLGTATANDLSPYVFVRALGMPRSSPDDDLIFLTGSYFDNSSDRYTGARPCLHL